MTPLIYSAPFIVVASLAITWSLRRRHKLALLVAVATNVLSGIAALLLLALTSGSNHEVLGLQLVAATSSSDWGAPDRSRDRRRRVVDRGGDCSCLHGRRRPCGDQREARDLRTGDGHRRPRRRDCDLRSRDRGRIAESLMGRIAVLGDRHRIQALAIAGVESHAATTDEEAEAAWQTLPFDVAVLILTPQSAAALAHRLGERRDLLVTVLP